MRQALWLSCVCVALTPAVGRAQGKEAVVLFKDGFSVKGKVVEKRDFIIDPATGRSFTIPAGNGFVYVDDVVRRIHFSPSQVQDVIDIKPEQLKAQMRLHMKGSNRRGQPVPSTWEFESISDWNNKWERTIKVKTEFGRTEIVQRISDITPYWMIGLTIANDWDFAYLTQEFGAEATRTLVKRYLADQGNLKEHERRFALANFLRQAGWLDMADKELEIIAEKFADQKEAATHFRGQIHQQQADLLVEEMERKYQIGQHQAAQDRLGELAKDDDLAKLFSDKGRLTVQDLRARYAELNAQINLVKEYLAQLPKQNPDRQVFGSACKVIQEELNLDTVTRLKTFAEFAQQHAKELKDGRNPTQRADEVLALAITGWLQGDASAEPDPKAAMRLFRARSFLLDYLQTESAESRAQSLRSFTKQHDIPADAWIRLIRHLPPPQVYTEKLDTGGPTKMTIEVPDSDGGTYWLQLPPEYNPLRSYPVLVLLQSHREKADVLVKRWQEEAAKHGFILAAPLWGGRLGIAPVYEYTRAQQAVVLDTMRDVRRRFNVDSDRVFLFGWEQGANAAFDIGLSHPDQFAGVLPMNGAVKGFPAKYWPNAQYLPFYIVEGDRNGPNPKATRIVFKDWIRGHYPSLYIEYKGRASEWYSAELPSMMQWMSHKKRHHPMKEMGRHHTGGGAAGLGEEFKTMRPGDNRFYWLSTDDIMATHLNEYHGWNARTLPATLQATIGVANESDLKTGAKIWTQVNIRTSGVRQVSLWVAPNQIDLNKPVLIRVNGAVVGGYRTIRPNVETLLEELYRSGDRERPFIARIDIGLERSAASRERAR